MKKKYLILLPVFISIVGGLVYGYFAYGGICLSREKLKLLINTIYFMFFIFAIVYFYCILQKKIIFIKIIMTFFFSLIYIFLIAHFAGAASCISAAFYPKAPNNISEFIKIFFDYLKNGIY